MVGCLILAMSLGELQPDSASASELESYNPQYNLCVGICVAQGIGAADDSKDFTMDLKVNFFLSLTALQKPFSLSIENMRGDVYHSQYE